MGPGKGKADDGDGQHHGGDEMAERQPPARQHQPDQIADQAERSGADVVLAGDLLAIDRLLAERQQACRRAILNAARAQGRPMMVIAMITAAIIQPAAIHRPPKTIQSTLSSSERGDMPKPLKIGFWATG